MRAIVARPISLARIFSRKPMIEVSAGEADCGYLCVSAVLAEFGIAASVDAIKSVAGRTDRGLTLSQLRKVLNGLGIESRAIYFDRAREGALPVPSIALCGEGHYVFVRREAGDCMDLYDPAFGNVTLPSKKLRRRCNGLALQIDGCSPVAKTFPKLDEAKAAGLERTLRDCLRSSSWRTAVVIFLVSQTSVLLIPLLSMWVVDGSVEGLNPGTTFLVFIVLWLISLLTLVCSAASDMIHNRLRDRAQSALSRLAFGAIERQRGDWFERTTPTMLQHRLGSLRTLLQFRVDLVRSLAIALVSVIAGAAVLLIVSPALLVPGFVTLVLTVVIDLAFQPRLEGVAMRAVEHAQRADAFVIETLSQLTQAQRQGSAAAVKRRFRALSRQRSLASANLESWRSWKQQWYGIFQAAGNLLFFGLAAHSFGQSKFALGGFVAVAAYKDLLSNSLLSAVRLGLERRHLRVHELQAGCLFGEIEPDSAPQGLIADAGELNVSNLTFAYSSFEKPTLSGLDLHVAPGEFVVIRGASGTGKSTLVKIICGLLRPDQGSVTINGHPVARNLRGIAAVLQSDRLVQGSLAENLTFFRQGVPDAELWRAIDQAQLSDFVRSLPLKLKTRVSEGCSGLSGGQRQRILLARAFLADPKLLLLDEATSSLDVDCERAIFATTRSTGCTLIAVGHRPELWSMADRVIDLSALGASDLSSDPVLRTA